MDNLCSDCGSKTDPLNEECLGCGRSQSKSLVPWFSIALLTGIFATLFLVLWLLDWDGDWWDVSSGTWLLLTLAFWILTFPFVCLGAIEDS